MQQIYSMGQVAKLLGVQKHRIEYAIATGQLADTKFRFLGKRGFDNNDLRRIAKHFGVKVKGENDVQI